MNTWPQRAYCLTCDWTCEQVQGRTAHWVDLQAERHVKTTGHSTSSGRWR